METQTENALSRALLCVCKSIDAMYVAGIDTASLEEAKRRILDAIAEG